MHFYVAQTEKKWGKSRGKHMWQTPWLAAQAILWGQIALKQVPNAVNGLTRRSFWSG